MAVTKISIGFIIACFILEKVGAKLSCQLLEEDGGETVECENDETLNTITLYKDLIPVSNNAKSISLSDCNIGACEVDVFENLPLLQTIDLSSNYLDNIIIGTFDRVPALEELNLSNNIIEYLPVDLFKRNHNLRSINLKSNSLLCFEVGMFDSLVNLTKLDFSNNEIEGEYLQSELFYHNVHVTVLKFSSNYMIGTPADLLSRFNNLKILELKNCYLNDFPTFLMSYNLKTLINLSMRSNEITHIDNGDLDHLVNLVILNLSWNKLEYIAENSFRTLSHLTIVSLNDNSLVSIPQGLFRSLPQLHLLNLSRNMITVLPDDLFKRNSLKYLNVSYNRLTYLQSDFCRQQKKLGILKLFVFNHNPWQCACLRELLSEVKDLRINYNPANIDDGNPVCATTSEFICKRDETLNSFYVDLFNSTVQ